MAFNNNNKMTLATLMMIFFFCATYTIAVSAQAPPLDDPSASSSATACSVDADCDSGSFCREGFCGAYVLENDWCGGFLPPQDERRCAPGLKCTDFPTDPLLSDDGNGYCRIECSTSADCASNDFCAADGVCRQAGSCSTASDCDNAENNWVRPLCIGATSCNEESRQCSFTCSSSSGSGKTKPILSATRPRPLASASSAAKIAPRPAEALLAKIVQAQQQQHAAEVAAVQAVIPKASL